MQFRRKVPFLLVVVLLVSMLVAVVVVATVVVLVVNRRVTRKKANTVTDFVAFSETNGTLVFWQYFEKDTQLSLWRRYSNSDLNSDCML